MPLSEAKSLLKKSNRRQPADNFHVFEHDRAADLAALEQLADSLSEFSPIGGLAQNDWPDSIFLDVTGLAHLFGSEHKIAAGVAQHCQDLGYLTCVTIANTLGLAWGIARFGSSETETSVTVLPHDSAATNQALADLPVPALRLKDSTLETLEQLGIAWVGQLLRLSRADLATRFGDEINCRIDQASGKLDEPIVARHPPPEFQAEQFLEFPTSDRETIEVILSRLVADICKQMKARQQGALQWTIRLSLSGSTGDKTGSAGETGSAAKTGDSPLEFRVNLFQPTATVAHVMQLAQMQLEQVLQPHTRKRRTKKAGSGSYEKTRQYTTFQVCEVAVSVTSCVLLVERQRQLFDENPRLDKQSLAHLINRLTSRLGQENVVYPTLQSGAQPEYTVRFRPLVDPRRRHTRSNAKSKQSSHVMARPLRLLNPPLEIESRDVPPLPATKIRRPPALLIHDGGRQKIVNAWGPERIETGWWRGPTIRRDYWRIETENGQQFWIFRNLRTQKWFLHGEF